LQTDEITNRGETLGLKWIGKPDSVVTRSSESQRSFILLLDCSRNRATIPEGYGRTTQPSYLALLQVGFAKRPPSLVNR
jgi:hypothetical protein